MMGEETTSKISEGDAAPVPSTDGQAAKNTAAQKGKGPRKRTKTGCLSKFCAVSFGPLLPLLA